LLSLEGTSLEVHWADKDNVDNENIINHISNTTNTNNQSLNFGQLVVILNSDSLELNLVGKTLLQIVQNLLHSSQNNKI